MAAGSMSAAAVGGARRRRRRPVMSEINVTPFVDVMLVLLIIFMVSAPLLTVGVPIDLPQSQAKALQQDNEPLTISVNVGGQIFLQNSEINVTPFADVMLVLLIIFMVSAPLLTVGVPIDLPQSQAKALQQDNEPLTVSVNVSGQIFLQNTEIKIDDLIPKLKAIIEARAGNFDSLIYVRGDRKVDYGTMMRVMGRISGAGYHKVALVTEVEQSGR